MSVTAAQLAAYNDLGNGSGLIYFTDPAGNLEFLKGKGLGVPNDSYGKQMVLGRIQGVESATSTFLFRVFLDTAAVDVAVRSGEDITELAYGRTLGAAPSVQDVVVTANTVSFVRDSSIMLVRIDGDTTMGNANRVDTFTVAGAVEGDRVTLSGIDGAVSPVLTTGAFSYLEYEITLVGDASTVTFILSPTGDWNQITPFKADAASIRNMGIPVPAQPGVYQYTPIGGTQVIHPGATGVSAPGDNYETDVVQVGAGVVLGSDIEFRVDTTNAINGDTGSIYGANVPITLAGNNVHFADPTGIKTTLTEELALSGKWAVQWLVTDQSNQEVAFSLVPDFGSANTQFLVTAMYADASVTDAKLATGINGSKITAGSVPETGLSALVQAKLNAQGRNRVSLSVPTAEVLTLNSVPVLVASAPGVGYAILVESVIARINYAGVIYATNLNLQVIFSGAGEAVAESSSFLVRTANGIVNIPLVYTVGAAVSQILENTDLYLTVEAGDPTAGTSDIFVTVTYSIVAV